MAVGPGRTGLFSTTGSIGGAPNWPASSGGHQIVQGSAGSQTGNTGFRQGTPIRQVMGPFGRPEPSSGNMLVVAQPAQQPPVQQQQPQTPPAPQAVPVNLPAGQLAPTPQGQPAGPPGGQLPPGPPPGGPPGGLPQAAALQQVAQVPHGTDGAMKGVTATCAE